MSEKQEIVSVEAEFKQELVKENVTDTIIAGLKTSYMGLTINGKDDKEGYLAVKRARIECRDLRVLAVKIAKKGREHANAVSKAWIAKEKEVVGQISEVEDYLAIQEDAVDKEIEAEKEADRLKKEEWKNARLARLAEYGDAGDIFVITDMPDDMFEDRVASAKKLWEEAEAKKAEEARLAEEKRKGEEALAESNRQEAARLESIKQEQAKKDESLAEDRRKFEQEKKDEVDRKERERIAEEKRLQDIADQKKREEEAVRLAEERQKSREAEEARLAELAPDKEKLAAYADEIMAVRCLDLATEDGKAILRESMELLAKAIVILKQ